MPLPTRSPRVLSEVARGLVTLVGPQEAAQQLTRLYGWDRAFHTLAALHHPEAGRGAYAAAEQLWSVEVVGVEPQS